MSLKLGRSGKDDEAASAEDQEERLNATGSAPTEPTASDAPDAPDTQGAYADSGVSPDVTATPTFSAVWGTPDTSTTSEDSGDLDDSDQADTSDTPETSATAEGSIVPDIPEAPETSDATEATSAPDTSDTREGSGAANSPGVTEISSKPDISDASSRPEPAADDGRLSVATRLEEAAGDLDRPLLAHVAGLRASWQRIQFGFVDDPQEAVEDAADLVEHTAQALASALQQRYRLLRSLWDRNRPTDDLGSHEATVSAEAPPRDRPGPTDATPDTEDLRLLMQRYRAMFNEICRP
jgi:hypothetical protein